MEDSIRAVISRKDITRVLIFAVAALAILGTAASIAHPLGINKPDSLIDLLHLDREGNFPAWYSSFQLLIAAALLWMVGRSSYNRWERTRWLMLAAVFAFLSVDESVAIHEILILPFRKRLHLDGIFFYGWVLAAMPVVIGLGFAYFRLVWALPKTIRAMTIAAGAIYLSGAMGMEMVDGAWAFQHGPDNLGYAVLTSIEEILELAGIALWISALLRYLEQRRVQIELVMGEQEQPVIEQIAHPVHAELA